MPLKDYALGPKPLGTGGQAEVFSAQHRPSGMNVALKRLLPGADSDAVARMRREIDAQQSIKSRHVMPVLESAPDFTWYTMPVADAVLWDAPLPIGDSELVEILKSCVAVLETANKDGAGHLHRDITPRNIMRITWDKDTRWVLADWGLVRRPRGQTTELRTRPNAAFGTEGFAGPEQSQDAHEADHRTEIYALGRVAAWALTGTRPLPNLPLLPSGRWRPLVAKATDADVQWRFQSWADFADALERVLQGPPETPLGRARAALPGAQAGNSAAAQLILRLAAANPEDGAILYDVLPEVPKSCIAAMVDSSPDALTAAIRAMARGFFEEPWGYRNADSIDSRVNWMFHSVKVAASANRPDLMVDLLATILDTCCARDRWAGQREFWGWVYGVRGRHASAVADYLTLNPDVARWLEGARRGYGELDPALQSFF